MSSFSENEKLYRAVRPLEHFWTKDGTRLSSAAFRTRKGESYLSVDRQDGRANDECIKAMRKKLEGAIVSVTYEQCTSSQIKIEPHPSTHNPWHCGLVNGLDENNPRLSKLQSQNLADYALIEYK